MDETAVFLEQHIPALRRYAFALVRQHDAADDLVQDCLERAIGRWHLRHHDGDLKAWLLTILRNQFINTYRQKQPPRDSFCLGGCDRAANVGRRAR